MFRQHRTFALLLCLVLLVPGCSKDGDTITYEVASASPPASGSILAVSNTNVLFNVLPSAPGNVISAVPIQGMAAGADVVGIDYRPSDKRLYAWTDLGHLYRIDPVTGVALRVSNYFVGIGGAEYGFDFSPVADRIRIVTDSDANSRLDPDDLTVFSDGLLDFAVGDVNAGDDPYVVAIAYSNNVAGATTTTLYGIDNGNDVLVTVNPPNSGDLHTVGLLGPNALIDVAFDIGANGAAYAAFQTDVTISLYSINLSTGAATLLGPLGTGGPIGGWRSCLDAV